MKTLTIMYLAHCPYCKKAKQALMDLLDEVPSYRNVPVEWIEESQQPALADTYDYWRVPSLFIGKEKLFEASPADTYDTIRAALKDAPPQVRSRVSPPRVRASISPSGS